MIEEQLINYGVLGFWTISLLYDKIKFQRQMKQAIENNTIAFTKVYEIVNKCKK